MQMCTPLSSHTNICLPGKVFSWAITFLIRISQLCATQSTKRVNYQTTLCRENVYFCFRCFLEEKREHFNYAQRHQFIQIFSGKSTSYIKCISVLAIFQPGNSGFRNIYYRARFYQNAVSQFQGCFFAFKTYLYRDNAAEK